MLSDSGLLIISSPYTWKPEHTKPERWLGGLVRETGWIKLYYGWILLYYYER